MNAYGIDLLGRRRRRWHRAESKATVIGECLRQGVSVAAGARTRPECQHGAQVGHRWPAQTGGTGTHADTAARSTVDATTDSRSAGTARTGRGW